MGPGDPREGWRPGKHPDGTGPVDSGLEEGVNSSPMESRNHRMQSHVGCEGEGGEDIRRWLSLGG